jgi:D-arabinan exo alpha-(1,3)/(1,5)-arabinofuranosidase (non-reducing end)
MTPAIVRIIVGRTLVAVLAVAFHFASAVPSSGEEILLAIPPEPQPVAPPHGTMKTTNPMASLSATQNYSASRVSSYEPKGGPRDNVWVPTDGSEMTLADIEGPGAITHIWTTHRGGGRDLILRAYWDGSEHPSVEAPLGDFFGVAMGVNATMNSQPIQVASEGRSRNCWWYMPFGKSARITVTATDNEENRQRDTVPLYFYIDYQVYDAPIEDLNYFHVRFRETDPAERGKPITLAQMDGAGHFVGVVMGQRSRTPGWFGEGDDMITVDGKLSFWGTGTEDYFNDAWGFRVFSYPYHGAPVVEGREVGDLLSVYRFHIADPIPFRKTFKFEIEHWPWISPRPNTGRDYFSSTSFWYQNTIHKPWPRLKRVISNEPWDPEKGRWHVEGSVEAESLKVLAHTSTAEEAAKPNVQWEMPNLSGDHMLSFNAGDKGKLSVAVPVQETGVYTVGVYYTRAQDFGKVQLSVNGERIGEPVDTFLQKDDLSRPIWPPKRFDFRGVRLKRGENVFQFAVDSKNPESKGYRLAIDCLVLEKEGG